MHDLLGIYANQWVHLLEQARGDSNRGAGIALISTWRNDGPTTSAARKGAHTHARACIAVVDVVVVSLYTLVELCPQDGAWAMVLVASALRIKHQQQQQEQQQQQQQQCI